MKEYLERALRQKVAIEKDENVLAELPLVFKGRYDIYKVETNGALWTAIHPKDEAGLVMLRKDRIRIEKRTGLNCALFLDQATFYIKEKLMEEGIPFVIKGKQVYLPFIGYLLNNHHDRDLLPVHQISFLTQKMLLTAIYGNWTEVKVTEAAKRLDISRMSASRCFDEIECLDIQVLDMKGKSRVITVPEDKKNFWFQTMGILRDPVIRRFVLEKDFECTKKAGISALCEYSLLSDNLYPTYAITKREVSDLNIKAARQVQLTDDVGCVILELGYFIDFDGKGTQDPFSVVLSLTEAEKEDERVEISVDEMLEEYVWSKG